MLYAVMGLLTYLETAHMLIVVNCGALTNPTNGQVSHTGGTTYGQTATYSCNTGYNLVGNSTRTCQATGMWSGSEPTCQGMLLLVSHIYACAQWRETVCLCKIGWDV